MHNTWRYLALALVLSSAARASLEPTAIPRSESTAFRTTGLFEGGRETRADLESLRVAQHGREGFERWVIDFSDEKTRAVGGQAPKFQIEYVKARKFLRDDGVEQTALPAKFVFRFQAIRTNHLTKPMVQKLARKSRYVKEIILYPPVERGDMAMEFRLRDDVRFDPFQPLEREGRLVLDLRPASK